MEDKGGSEKRGLFEREALPHVDALYSAALRLSRNPDDARDLLQETVLRAYRFFHQYTPGTNCRAWLLTILYNNFRNGYRGADREQVSLTPEDFEREVEGLSARAASTERRSRVCSTTRAFFGSISRTASRRSRPPS